MSKTTPTVKVVRMLAVFRVLAFGLLLVNSIASAALNCDAVLGKDPYDLTINDVQKVTNTSAIQYNFKLAMVGLYQVIETQYGPLNFKPATVKIDWDKMKVEGLKAAGTYETTLDQYYGISNFMAQFNDAHVSVELPSTLTAKLPLQSRVVHGDKIVVNFINENYPKGYRKPGIGDEIIAINGKSPKEFQAQFPAFNSAGNDVTNFSLFGLTLGRWSESRGLPLSLMKLKDIELTFRSFTRKDDIYKVTLPFELEGIGLIGKDIDGKDPSPRPVVIPIKKADDKTAQLAPKTLTIVQMAHNLMRTEVTGVLKDLQSKSSDSEKGEGQKIELGGRLPFFKLPADFKELKVPMMMKVPPLSAFVDLNGFYAGTFTRNGKRVGFLRIPSYSPDSVISIATTIRYIMGRLQKETDYLVIDQTNNPGGMVIMSDMILKALNGKYDKEKHMRFAVKPTQKFLRQYADLIQEIAKNEDKLFTNEELATILVELNTEYKKIYQAHIEGRDLSEPISMLAISEYSERSFDRALFKLPFIGSLLNKISEVDLRDHQTYTKPVYFMINELDFSGGDATPAGFSDYGRGTLVGTRENTRTAGAGGTVEEFNIRSAIEVTIHLTTSLMVRFKNFLVENLGVKSELNVPITQEDVANGNATYFDRVMQSIERHLAQSRQRQL